MEPFRSYDAYYSRPDAKPGCPGRITMSRVLLPIGPRSTVAVTESVFEISSLIFVPSQNLKPPRQARRAESALDHDDDGPGDDGGPVTTGPRGRRAAGRLMDLEIAAGGRRMGLEMAGQVAGSRVWMPVTRTVVQVLFG
jgi:hypothetical protein